MDVVYSFVTPPGSCLCCTLLGLGVLRWRKKLGWWLVALGLLGSWLTSTPLVAGTLLRSLQVDAPLRADGDLPPADAIVVLGAGVAREAEEFGAMTVDSVGLERLRYAAWLHRRTGRPILVTAGPAAPGDPSVAELMARVLEGEFGVPVRWRETTAENTAENARASTALLTENGIERVYLVTHAWHMPRARGAFERAGLPIVAAPTGFRAPQDLTVASFLPSAKAVRETSWACHEWIGRVWYAVGD